MRVPASVVRRSRATMLVAFLAAAGLFFAYLWVNFGGQIPGITGGYRVTAVMSDVQNLQPNSEVRMAGIGVGKVHALHVDGDKVRTTLQLGDEAAPLHQGAKLRLRAKTLLEETYVEVTDGNGTPLEDGAVLPVEAQLPSVQLDDVLNSLDAPSRATLSSLVQRLGRATAGRGGDLAAAVEGLGRLGREGHDALDVLAAESEELKALTAEATELLELLDEGEGRLVRIVDAADRVTGATAGQATHLEAAIRLLPEVLDGAREAAAPLRSLTGALAPLAPPLQAAVPDLNAALVGLRPVAADLRAALPPLDRALGRAPATLAGAIPVAADLQTLVPPLRTALADLNPMLGFLAPYAPDVTALVANVADALHAADPDGQHYLRLIAILTEDSMNEMPFSTTKLPPTWSNAYPDPGSSGDPQPFSGEVPQVKEEPKS